MLYLLAKQYGYVCVLLRYLYPYCVVNCLVHRIVFVCRVCSTRASYLRYDPSVTVISLVHRFSSCFICFISDVCMYAFAMCSKQNAYPLNIENQCIHNIDVITKLMPCLKTVLRNCSADASYASKSQDNFLQYYTVIINSVCVLYHECICDIVSMIVLSNFSVVQYVLLRFSIKVADCYLEIRPLDTRIFARNDCFD